MRDNVNTLEEAFKTCENSGMETCDVFPFDGNNLHQITKGAFAQFPTMKWFSVFLSTTFLLSGIEQRVALKNLSMTSWKISADDWVFRREFQESEMMAERDGFGRIFKESLSLEQKLATRVTSQQTQEHEARYQPARITSIQETY